MDLVPKFWTFLETELNAGTIRMPKMCFDEITDGTDDLAKWCKQRKSIGYFCCKSNKAVQESYGIVANYVATNKQASRCRRFLEGGRRLGNRARVGVKRLRGH